MAETGASWNSIQEKQHVSLCTYEECDKLYTVISSLYRLWNHTAFFRVCSS